MEDMFRIDPRISCSEGIVEFESFSPATGFQERVDNTITTTTTTTATTTTTTTTTTTSTATVLLPFESNDRQNERGSSEMCELIKTQIANHPRYPNLVSAYIECRKVGAPPETASLLEEISLGSRPPSDGVCGEIGADPELDEFMESYCKVLLKYKEELSKPFDEATSFLSNIETQLFNLCKGIPPATSATCHSDEVAGSSEEELCCGELEASESQETAAPRPGDQGLKEMLLRKYSGYLSSLRKEFLKKRKKGKLPKDARMLLLDWWNSHYRWPYPTEEEKMKLAELTGLDQKQINNWFINQRKRHWKPSEDMRFAVMEGVSGSAVPLPCGDNLRRGGDDLNGV